MIAIVYNLPDNKVLLPFFIPPKFSALPQFSVFIVKGSCL